MKKIPFMLVCYIITLQVFAQSSINDVSRIVSETDWHIKQISENIIFKQAQIRIFDSEQSISILEITPSSTVRLGINDVSDTLIRTSQLCKQVDAVAGVNASFFDMKNGGSVDFVRVNGEILHGKTKISQRNNAALVIDKHNVKIIERDTTDNNWEDNLNYENVIVAGPLIMKNGTLAELQQNSFNTNRHPRTFAATKTNGNVLLIVVDGRNAKAAGMSINELYILAKALDCNDAMNFDGGGSSAMYIDNEDENGIMNYPSDNKLFDHHGERRVANAVYVKKFEQFKFAFLTDIHTGTATSEEDLLRCIEDINSQNDIDFVIVNGDVTENGLNSELKTVKNRLDKLNKRYYAIAGNHETKWTESGHTYFAQMFGDTKVAFKHKGIQFVGFSSGPVLRMGDAHVSPREINWLKNTLQSMENIKQPVIVFTHVPLIEPADQIDNGHEIADIIRKYNTRVILNGHYHHNRALDADGIPAIICRSILRDKKPVGGYSIFTVDADSLKVFERNPIEKTEKHWYSLSMTKEYYSKSAEQHNLSNDSINSLYPNLKIKWQLETGGIITNTAAVDNNKVIAGNELGEVYCIDLQNGEIIWKYKTRNAVYSTPAIENNNVVFGSCDSSIYCLNVENGEKIWELKTNHTVMGSPVIENGIVYIGGSDGNFRAINLNSGKLVWTFSGIKGYVESKALIYDNKIIFGAWDTNLYALNKKDGTLAWIWNNGHSRLHFSPAACIPVASDGKIFIVAPDRYMTAIDAKTGKTAWRTNKHRVRETIGISEDKSKVYARCFVDTVFCISATANDFEELWFTKTGYTYDINPSMPVEKDGIVFFVTKNGMFVALKAEDGAIVWKYKFNNTMIATVTPLNSRELIFTSHDGIIGKLANDE
ncbi:MAG: PQQ-binding-like beta-propeller repeat protein [Prevotellaceae bacterium]|jgi:outer membrane protein assembly factor BamB/exopolysaccharide biosynthesis protein/Icc-related predicted phosphoesterase|nr:PQQ-binding-like beta-propeller repeat protein [Prevotellaceae bacterium]